LLLELTLPLLLEPDLALLLCLLPLELFLKLLPEPLLPLEWLLMLLPLEWLELPPEPPPKLWAKAESPTTRLATAARIAILLRVEVFIVLTPGKMCFGVF
jgi:hypothetical protein